MSNREAIIDLISDYAWANDSHDVSILERIFAPEIVLTFDMVGVPDQFRFEGKEAVNEFMSGAWAAQSDQRRHVATNFKFTDETATSAHVRAYLGLCATDNGVLTTIMGTYNADVVFDGSAWTFTTFAIGLDAPM
jgi:hypothetical protein